MKFYLAFCSAFCSLLIAHVLADIKKLRTTEIKHNLALKVHEIVSNSFPHKVNTVIIVKPTKGINYKTVDLESELLSNMFLLPQIAVQLHSYVNINQISKQRKCCFIFLVQNFDNFLEIYNQKYLEVFSSSGFYLIVTTTDDDNFTEVMLKLLWKIRINNVHVVFKDANSRILIKSFTPFRSNKCNDFTPIISHSITNETLQNFSSLFPGKIKNLHKCPIRLAISNESEPVIFVKRFFNGTVRRYSGSDINLIETLSELMNFTLNIYDDTEGYFYENGTSTGPLKRLLDSEAELSISTWLLKKSRLKYFDSSIPYTFDSVILIVPPGRELTSFEKIVFTFSPNLWMSLIACICIGCFVIFVTRQQSQFVQNFVFGTRVTTPYLNFFVGLIGSSQNVLPKGNFARYLLMMLLMFSLIIRTLYQGAYFRILQTRVRHEEVTSIEEMIDRNFKFYLFSGVIDLFQGNEAVKLRFDF